MANATGTGVTASWLDRHPMTVWLLGAALVLAGPAGVVGNAVLAWRTHATLRHWMLLYAAVGLTGFLLTRR